MSSKALSILQRADVDRLPSLPHVLLPLLDACQDESIDYTRIATLLSYDPGLTARIHAVCHATKQSRPGNSCEASGQTGGLTAGQAGGQSGNQNSGHASERSLTEHGLRRLGINTIKSIAVSAAVQQFFSRTSVERTAFLKSHWHHSLRCALVCRALADHCNYAAPDEAYNAGLLHDVGQLVLENAYPQKYSATLAELSEDDNFHNLEQDEFGTTHQAVGAALLGTHGASSFIQDAIRFHHESADSLQDAHLLLRIVHVANTLSSRYFKAEDKADIESAKQLLQLERATLIETLESVDAQLNSITTELELDLEQEGLDGESARQQEASDEFKQLRLAEQVRNIALLDSMHQHMSRCDNQQQLLHTVSEQVSILFAINDCIMFLYNASDDRLDAVATGNMPTHVNEISIPLVSGRSIITDALLQKQALHSFPDDNDPDNTQPDSSHQAQSLSVIDRQIIGVCGHDGIACLPMMMNKSAIGCIVLGIDAQQRQSLWKQLNLLNRMVSEIAHTLSAYQGNPSSPGQEDALSALQHKIREVLHEVRNPLSIINNYLGLLSYKLEKDKPAQEDVETIKAEIERVNQVLNRLTSKQESTSETAPVDLNGIIADLTQVFQASLFSSKNIEISLDLDDRIEAFNSNANALKQIYTNLIKNGVEALPANGQIMVYTQDYVNVDGKEHIEICVADDGPGIDIDILPKLFSPIDSTKGEGHAGLGLTIVKNLVNELGGSISCRSSDKGTSFHILLPR